MPELPEIHNLRNQLRASVLGARVAKAEFRQEKCLNRAPDAWREIVCGREIERVEARGKWCELRLAGGAALRLNLGMGGEFLLRETERDLPEKRRAALWLEDGRCLSVNFWWFGSLHAVAEGEAHAPFDRLGRDMLDETRDAEDFLRAYSRSKSPIKTMMQKQELLSGLGNYYAHDLFFDARVHPLRPANELTEAEYGRLYASMRRLFAEALALGGADYERDLYDRAGGFSKRAIAYREGEPCPICGQPIEALRTGATNGFVCANCQRR